MLPAYVAPSVMGPPSSPFETTTAPGPRSEEHTSLPQSQYHPLNGLPPVKKYVPLVGALAAMFDAPVPVALFPRSAPVGETSRIQGAKCAYAVFTVPMLSAL